MPKEDKNRRTNHCHVIFWNEIENKNKQLYLHANVNWTCHSMSTYSCWPSHIMEGLHYRNDWSNIENMRQRECMGDLIHSRFQPPTDQCLCLHLFRLSCVCYVGVVKWKFLYCKTWLYASTTLIHGHTNIKMLLNIKCHYPSLFLGKLTINNMWNNSFGFFACYLVVWAQLDFVHPLCSHNVIFICSRQLFSVKKF